MQQESEDSLLLHQSKVAELTEEIDQLERAKSRLEWMSVGEKSYQKLKNVVSAGGKEDDQLLSIQNQLAVWEKISGVRLTDVLLSKIEDGTFEYVVSGSSHGVLFEVKFHDPQADVRPCRITNLEINSIDDINNDLENFLDLCENESSLGLFMSVFVPYSWYLSERKSTYKKLERLYPGAVQASGATLHVTPSHAAVPTTFSIDWQLIVNEVYQVTPSLHLTVSCSNTACEEVSEAAALFGSMLETCSSTDAVTMFTQSVCSANP